MIYGPYRSHASHGNYAPTKIEPWGGAEPASTARRTAGRSGHRNGAYFARALELALSTWLKARAR